MTKGVIIGSLLVSDDVSKDEAILLLTNGEGEDFEKSGLVGELLIMEIITEDEAIVLLMNEVETEIEGKGFEVKFNFVPITFSAS